jgi:hypothetical protein
MHESNFFATLPKAKALLKALSKAGCTKACLLKNKKRKMLVFVSTCLWSFAKHRDNY